MPTMPIHTGCFLTPQTIYSLLLVSESSRKLRKRYASYLPNREKYVQFCRALMAKKRRSWSKRSRKVRNGVPLCKSSPKLEKLYETPNIYSLLDLSQSAKLPETTLGKPHVLVLVDDPSTSYQLQKLLSDGPGVILRQKMARYRKWQRDSSRLRPDIVGAGSAPVRAPGAPATGPDSRQSRVPGKRRKVGATESIDDNDSAAASTGADDDANFADEETAELQLATDPEQDFLECFRELTVDPILFYSCRYNLGVNLAQVLTDYQPRFIILYDQHLAAIRQVCSIFRITHSHYETGADRGLQVGESGHAVHGLFCCLRQFYPRAAIFDVGSIRERGF